MRQLSKPVYVIFIIYLCSLLFSCPQSKQLSAQTESLSDEELESGKTTLTYEEAFVIFVAGEVFVKGKSDWEYLEIGNILHQNKIIKTEADSVCELQFGQKAVVRIQENTEICIKDFWLEPAKTAVAIDLVAGSLLCKVRELTAAESFKVRTRTATCGVRGTEFRVYASGSNKTILAVKEGEVTIIPASIEMDKINKEAQIKNTRLKVLIQSIEDAALVVAADQEVTIDQTTTLEIEQIVDGMVDEVKKADRKEEITEKDVQSIDKIIKDTNKKINQAINPPQAISAESEEELKTLDKVDIKQIRVVPITGTEDELKTAAKAEVPVLIKVKITTDPKDADIYLDNLFMGKGRFQKLYEEGKILHFIIKKSGFTSEGLTIETKKSMQKEYAVLLHKLSETEKEDEDNAAASPDAAYGNISILTAAPGELYYDGVFKSKIKKEEQYLLEKLEAGVHTFEMKYEEDHKESKQIVVEEGKTVKVVFEWVKTVEKKSDKHNDEFDSPTLSSRWAWIREKPDKWSLTERPGWMTITTQRGSLWELENNTKNLLLMKTINKDFSIDTKVEINTTMNWHHAGILVYKDDNNYILIQRIYNKGNKLEFTIETNGHPSPKYFSCKSPIVYLRIVKTGNVYSGFFSTDGKNYISAGKVTSNIGGNLKVGLLANNGASDVVGKKACFDYFRITYKD